MNRPGRLTCGNGVVLSGQLSRSNPLIRAENRPRNVRKDTATVAAANSPTQRQHRLSAAQQAELLEAYLGGVGTKELARKYRIHRATVTALLVRSGVPFHERGLRPEHGAEVVQLYRQGWSLTRLAERLHVDEMTVRAHLLKSNVTMRKPWERW